MLRGLLQRIPLPRPTLRLRLTILYGALFLASGAVLLAVTYVLVSHTTSGTVFANLPGGQIVAVQSGTRFGTGAPSSGIQIGVTRPVPSGAVGISGPAGIPPNPQQAQALASQLTALAAQQHTDQLNQLLVQSGIALGGMAVLSIVLGWLIAGRVLRPLRTITTTAQSISASNLHQRLALGGPNDELKELGNTFDALLGRLEQSFDAQRQFIANASHELRTPLARQRTVMEVALRDPAPSVESLRAASERVLAAGEQEERIIEALLTLARTERGLDRREPCDLAATTNEVLISREPEVAQRGLHLDTALGEACLSGDPPLVERLVANLVDNALRHNAAGGRVCVVTSTRENHAILWISNTGPVIPAGELNRLFERFQRLNPDRTARADGLGLGLAIVKAIAEAHGATISAQAPAGGGFEIEVAF